MDHTNDSISFLGQQIYTARAIIKNLGILGNKPKSKTPRMIAEIIVEFLLEI